MKELHSMNQKYRPQGMKFDELYKKQNSNLINGLYTRCVTVQNNDEFCIFRSVIHQLDYIILLKKADWRMCLFLSTKARWTARWINKHNIWFIFAELIRRYKSKYNYSINKEILDRYGDGSELNSIFNQINIQQQIINTSMCEALITPTEVICGNKTKSNTNDSHTSKKDNQDNSDENDSSFDQVLIPYFIHHLLQFMPFDQVVWPIKYCRKSRSQISVVKGLDDTRITQLACGEDFSMAAGSNGNVYVWCIKDGQIGMDPAIANMHYMNE